MSEDGVVLVVGSGRGTYREYLLAGAAARAPLWLLDSDEPTWQRPYIVGAEVVAMIDEAGFIPDQARLIDAAIRLAGQREVRGVFTFDEWMVLPAAHIAEALDLPGPSVAGADRCRNKHLCRQVLTAAGLPQPRFAMARTPAEARRAVPGIGYPLVLKPRGRGASVGVVRVSGPGELDDAFAVADRAGQGGAPAYQGGVLLEEYLDGPEISIDGAFGEGEYQPLCIAHKRVGLEPYFEELGHVVDAADPLLRDDGLAKVLVAAHQALGLRSAITHTEVRFTGRGPAIIEVNVRLGGDLIPYLGQLATGIDSGSVVTDVATGVWPAVRPGPPSDTPPSDTPVVGIRFGYPPRNCTVRSITLPEPGDTPGLLEAGAFVGPGAQLRLPPEGYASRYAYVICAAADAAGLQARLDTAVSRAVLDYDALP